MGLINMASGNSVWRGLDYCKEKKVNNCKKTNECEYQGVVNGSNDNKYNVFINIEHPRKSKCDCPHAKDTRIICKHMIALYFTAFPKEVDIFLKENEEAEKEYEKYEEELEEKMIKYVNSMSKSELQQTVLELLYDGPEWQYDRFIRDKIGY